MMRGFLFGSAIDKLLGNDANFVVSKMEYGNQ